MLYNIALQNDNKREEIIYKMIKKRECTDTQRCDALSNGYCVMEIIYRGGRDR